MLAKNRCQQSTLATHLVCASSTLDRMKGLLGHSLLPEGHGLWIKPCTSIHTFFMRFTIDVLFLSGDLQVVALYPEMKPYRLTAWIRKASSALELPQGSIAKTHTCLGNYIKIDGDPL